MTGRREVVAFGADETVAKICDLVGQAGASSFEIAYDRADGPPLRDDEEPAPGEPVRWTAAATWPDGSTVVGEHVTDRDYRNGIALACADLAGKLGAAVTVLDAR